MPLSRQQYKRSITQWFRRRPRSTSGHPTHRDVGAFLQRKDSRAVSSFSEEKTGLIHADSALFEVSCMLKLPGRSSQPVISKLNYTDFVEQSSAYGEFEVTHDCTDLTSASFLSEIGKKSKVLLRISTVGPERGSADTARDVHGWAMKIFTDEGNLDWVFNNTVSSLLS